MFYSYKTFLVLGALTLPFFILAFRNNFDSGKKTALRFGFAILAVWAYLLASRFIVDAVDLSLASTQEEIDAVYNGDGAKNVFALFFGWIPGLIIASASWLLLRGWRWLRTRTARHSNA